MSKTPSRRAKIRSALLAGAAGVALSGAAAIAPAAFAEGMAADPAGVAELREQAQELKSERQRLREAADARSPSGEPGKSGGSPRGTRAFRVADATYDDAGAYDVVQCDQFGIDYDGNPISDGLTGTGYMPCSDPTDNETLTGSANGIVNVSTCLTVTMDGYTFLGGWINEREGADISEAPSVTQTAKGREVVVFYKWTDNMGYGVSANVMYAAHGGVYSTVKKGGKTVVLGRGEGYAIAANDTANNLRQRISALAAQKK